MNYSFFICIRSSAVHRALLDIFDQSSFRNIDTEECKIDTSIYLIFLRVTIFYWFLLIFTHGISLSFVRLPFNCQHVWEPLLLGFCGISRCWSCHRFSLSQSFESFLVRCRSVKLDCLIVVIMILLTENYRGSRSLSSMNINDHISPFTSMILDFNGINWKFPEQIIPLLLWRFPDMYAQDPNDFLLGAFVDLLVYNCIHTYVYMRLELFCK